MAVGFEVYNDDGDQIIEQNTLNFGLITSGTLNIDQQVPYNSVYGKDLTISGLTASAICAIYTYNNTVALVGRYTSGSDTVFSFLGPNCQIIYYIFDKYAQVSVGDTYGLEVYTASGDVVFNSKYPGMNVRHFGLGGNTSLPTGRIYAVSQNKPAWFEFTTEQQYPNGEYPYRSIYYGVSSKVDGGEASTLLAELSTSPTQVGSFGEVPDVLVIDVTNIGVQPSGIPSYSVNPDVSDVDEGSSVTFQVDTTNVSNGTTLYWEVVGTVDSNDFTDNTMTGSATINSNTANIVRTLKNDITTEGVEDFSIELFTDASRSNLVATSPSVVVNDTSLNQWDITEVANNVDEGSGLTFNITTQNLVNGTTVYWTIDYNSSSQAADFSSTSGSTTVTDNKASIVVNTVADSSTEGSQTFKVQLRTGSTSGTVRDTSGTITINDTSTSADVTPDSVNWTDVTGEAGGLVFSIAQTISGIDSDIDLYCTITGSASITAFVEGSSAGDATSNFNVLNGQGVEFLLSSGYATSGVVNVRNASDGNTIIDSFNYTLTSGGGGL